MQVMLWNQDGTSDKLWGITESQGQTITFWGRRGALLTYKRIDIDEALTLRSKKLKKGYRVSSFEEIERETPRFFEEFESNLVMCLLGDGFHGESYKTQDSD